jgi:hypothetical protein
VAHLKRRLATVEAQMDQHQRHHVTWAEMNAASSRQHARVRRQVCRLLYLDEMAPCVMHAAAQLIHDSPEQSPGKETRHRWRQQQGKFPDNGHIRQRIAPDFEAMAAASAPRRVDEAQQIPAKANV